MNLTANAGRSMEGLINESLSSNCLEEEAITETKEEFQKHALKASMPSSSGKSLELMRVSNTKRATYGESSNTRIPEEGHNRGKVVITQLVKLIEERLSILEEGDEALKEAIFRSMEERKSLINEIFRQFQAIHNLLRVSNQERVGHSSFDEVLASLQARKKERRPGLMQVLWQESNPCLISRYAKARAVAVQGLEK